MLEKLKTLFKRRYRYRSDVTGKWVSRAYADANPDTTIAERVR